MKIGDRIRELRIKRGYTQDDMAEKLDMNRANFSNYERNVSLPPSDVLSKIADILKTSTDYLLGRVDNPYPPQKDIPEWATKKDIRDFKKLLEEDIELFFDGKPLSEEDKEKIKMVLIAMFWDAKKKNKRKKKTESKTE
jgi:transcriptional regulator with XRE-family HTH domain